MKKAILLNAASVARHNPSQFWNPSRNIRRRLRPPSEVQIRVVLYDDKSGADLWDSQPVWVRIRTAREDEFVGVVTTSDSRAKGFRVGNIVHFGGDQIFDVWELDRRQNLLPNRGRATFIRGKDIVVGLTYLNPDGSVDRRFQFHGTIQRAGIRTGILIRPDGSTRLFRLPPEFRSVQPASPGTYTLKTNGEVIENPTFVSTWDIHRTK